MMEYVPRLTVTLAHDYYGAAQIPLRLAPADPAGFDRQGLLLRRQGNRFLVIGEISDPVPERLSFDVLVLDKDVGPVTRFAEWGHALHLDLPLDTDAMGFGPARPLPGAMRNPMARLVRLSIALDIDAQRDVTLRFDAVEALWAYVVTGPGSSDTLEIVDPSERISFSHHGLKRLPDGSEARVIRSDQPLPARARPDQKFMLQRPSAFGPETLIPVLPAAGKMFKPIPDEGGSAARLQSDIYVTLW